MSLNDNIQLSINTNGNMNSFALITVFNAFDEVIKKSYSNLEVMVDRGLYRVTIEINENVIEKNLRLTKDHYEFIDLPQTYSSFLMENFESSHEYYTQAAMNWSLIFTNSDNNNEEFIKSIPLLSGSIFIFFRYSDKEDWSKTNKESLGKYFLLLNQYREIIVDFSKDKVKEDYIEGWLALHIPLSKGTYYLQYLFGEKREIPFYVFPQWQTQLFIIFKTKPLFSTLRISIERPQNGFKNYNINYYFLEGVIQKFINGIYYLPENELLGLAYGKWENPIMGILSAYIIMFSKMKKYDNLLSIVIRNLEENILKDSESPDLVMLKILHKIYLGENPTEMSISEPCMLMVGLRAIVTACSEFPYLIEKESFVEKITSNLYSDTIYTSFIPVTTYKREENQIIELDYYKNKSVDWISKSIVEMLQTKFGKDLQVVDIANRLNITPNVAVKTMKKILKLDNINLEINNISKKITEFEDKKF